MCINQIFNGNKFWEKNMLLCPRGELTVPQIFDNQILKKVREQQNKKEKQTK
jgi:hypothetical protein